MRNETPRFTPTLLNPYSQLNLREEDEMKSYHQHTHNKYGNEIKVFDRDRVSEMRSESSLPEIQSG